MSDIMGNDSHTYIKEGGAVAKAREERLKRAALAMAEKEAKKKAKEEEKSKEKANEAAEETEKAREKAEKEAREKAEKEAKEAEKAREKAEKEAEEAARAREKAEKKAREEAEKEAKEAEKVREKVEKEAKEAEKSRDKEAIALEDTLEDANNRYEYFYQQIESLENKDRVEEIRRGYKTSYDVVDGVFKIKNTLKNSERFFTKLAEYKAARLEYEINISKYEFGYSDAEIRRIEIEKEMSRRIRGMKLRALKACIFEFFDNRRYLQALNLTEERKTARTIARPMIIDRSKVDLLALLERRNEINAELLELYEKSSKEYLDAESRNHELNIRLRAKRRAFDKLYDIERKVEEYVFTPDEKAEVYRLMNGLVEMDADTKMLKYQEKHAPKSERESYKEAIKAKKDEMAKMEDALVALVDKAERRTYMDDKRHVWIWIAGVVAFAGILILLFSIFSEQITEFIMNWALESR